MIGHQWFTNQLGHTYYGPQTGNRLIGTKGIEIYPLYGGKLFISYRDQDGEITGPYIYCNEDEFEIIE